MRVLYVDDDRINTLLFEETCRFVGDVQLETAGSGAEALALAAGFLPQLLVIDLHLPDTTGYRLLGALRQCLGQPDLPAYLCTAEEPQFVAQPAQDAGYNGCWPKPVSVELVRGHLQRHGPTSSA